MNRPPTIHGVLFRVLGAALVLLATACGCDDSDNGRDALYQQRADLVKQQQTLETLLAQRTQGKKQYTEQEAKEVVQLLQLIRSVKGQIEGIDQQLIMPSN